MNTNTKKLDHRREYFMILDCETATLPFATKYDNDAKIKQRVAIAKPLIYDIGWTICDKKGNIYRRENYLIAETFSVPAVFNTAYYKDKRQKYLDLVNDKILSVVTWNTAIEKLIHDMNLVSGVGAFNAMFDFKKAIPFTDLYISQAYGNKFDEWLKRQEVTCDNIAAKKFIDSDKVFEPSVFRFRGKEYPLFDVWGLACKYLLNNDSYKNFCKENNFFTASGKYYKTSAEVVYRFLAEDIGFNEAHTALNDSEIEAMIFGKAVKKAKNSVEYGIICFPFRILGRIDE